MRYCITGGDNGYCARCGGLCDRYLLEIDDKKKTYRGIEGADICLGKWCWQTLCLGDWQLVRGENNYGDFYKMYGGKVYRLQRVGADGTILETRKVSVKNNKYGKDGEFGDRLDHYKFEGWGKVSL